MSDKLEKTRKTAIEEDLEKTEKEIYIQHNIAVIGMLSWLMRWQHDKRAFTIENGTSINLSLLPSCRFGLVYPLAAAYGKTPFLVMQNEELSWFKDIQWNRVVIQKGNPRIYFVSQKMNGFNTDMPEIPAFSFSIEFDFFEKIEPLLKHKKLNVKNIWFDDEQEAHIPKGRALLEMSIYNNKSNQPILSESETSTVRSYEDDILRMLEEDDRNNDYAYIKGESEVEIEDEFSHLLKGVKSREASSIIDNEKYKYLSESITDKNKKRRLKED